MQLNSWANTLATVISWVQVKLYNLGKTTHIGFSPTHTSSQNLVLHPSPKILSQQLYKICLTSIKPDQNCEHPIYFLSWVRVPFLKYLNFSTFCLVPSSFSNRYNHLQRRLIFLTSKLVRPRPPWSLGWQTSVHLTRWYFLTLSFSCHNTRALEKSSPSKHL
jgi:hypothetical protein